MCSSFLNRGMHFRSYDTLKLFGVVAEKMSFTAAALSLNMSKGAVSYQIAKLEGDLGFDLFERNHTRIALTPEGKRLWQETDRALAQIDYLISDLRIGGKGSLLVGMHTYFLARWLSPRLPRFTQANPDVGLRIEPINIAEDLINKELDLAVIWGDGILGGGNSELLFHSRTVPLASPAMAQKVRALGLKRAVAELPLLPDASGMEGWRTWHRSVGLPFNPQPRPIHLPDANNRVQAAISGHGIALLDEFSVAETRAGHLVEISDVHLEDFGYFLAFPRGRFCNAAAVAFRDWLINEAGSGLDPVQSVQDQCD